MVFPVVHINVTPPSHPTRSSILSVISWLCQLRQSLGLRLIVTRYGDSNRKDVSVINSKNLFDSKEHQILKIFIQVWTSQCESEERGLYKLFMGNSFSVHFTITFHKVPPVCTKAKNIWTKPHLSLYSTLGLLRRKNSS